MGRIAVMFAFAAAGSLPSVADFSFHQTTRITGGVVTRFPGASKPSEYTVLVKGHRMAFINPHSAEIVDSEKGTTTRVDFDSKTFSVTSLGEDQQDMRFKASTDETGQTKTIGTVETTESILKVTMEGSDPQTSPIEMASDVWLAPVAGFEEVRAFYSEIAEKLGYVPGQNSAVFTRRPDLMKGLAGVVVEMAKIDGAPLEVTTRMGGSGSAVQFQPAAGSSVSRASSPGFGRGRRSVQPSGDDATGATSRGAPLLEMRTELSGLSTAPVEDSKFEIPAGFKQVD